MAWAKVENGQIVKQFRTAKPYTDPVSGVQHPSTIFRLWSKEELNAIGIYEIEKVSSPYDSRTQRKGGTVIRYDSENNKVIETESISNIPVEDVKKKYIDQWKQQAFNLLQQTDWQIIRESEGVGRTANQDVKWWRNEIRLHNNTIEAGLEACTTLEQISAYLNIIPEWPKLEDYVPPVPE